ncbi:hypothetical protein FCH38_14925 [Agrobacterium tumefaciens]|nr:hypothetical protein [Agrobacterium sp. ICMP 6402]MQB10854.1 hypothetical protein [Agrobacterium sp. ICMP 6402]NTZ91961.1 hypothetical protein [Agrobacterium tumefaciens]
MAPLTPPPRIRLSRLRDIGWSVWDPIGLMPAGENWNDAGNLCFADEYDNYLIAAAGQLRRGIAAAEVADYLVGIEAEHMALGETPGCRERALAVVAAINADPQLWTLPEGQDVAV